ncbi:MAG TPA: MBL fold metallo-hydrolase [Acidimicrobiia bacterium]|nr:MBL fold metallo-hydrolase [Acidimicrobiia bacterium]
MATVDEWFTSVRVDDGLWHLSEPFVHPFARCNIWLVAGRDRALLIDTGLGVRALERLVRDFVKQPCAALATHYHFDHTGSLHEFSERLGHREAVAYLESADAIGGALHRRGYDPDTWRSFIDAGYDLPDELLTALPNIAFDVDRYAVTPCSLTRVLEEGDVIDLGDRAFTVLHLPGHSPDSIGLYCESDGVLFSGDAVYDGPLLDSGDDADVADYVATMKRLRELPVSVVHGGHEASFGRARLVGLCDAYLRKVDETRGTSRQRG